MSPAQPGGGVGREAIVVDRGSAAFAPAVAPVVEALQGPFDIVQLGRDPLQDGHPGAGVVGSGLGCSRTGPPWPARHVVVSLCHQHEGTCSGAPAAGQGPVGVTRIELVRFGLKGRCSAS